MVTQVILSFHPSLQVARQLSPFILASYDNAPHTILN